MKKQVKFLLFVLLALSLVLAACQPATQEPVAEEPAAEEMAEEEMAAEEPAEEEMAEEEMAEEEMAEEEMAEKPNIKFGDTQFQSLWINNQIAMFIVEHGYGYPVEEITMTTPIAQQSLGTGDIDVWMELWRANWTDNYNEQIDAGLIIDLGPTYDRSAQGWYVPTYVIEGNEERGIDPMAPDLKTVEDLKDYADLFPDPEDSDMGLFVSCIAGWQCAEINRVKFYAYGLEEYYNILEPGSAGALDAAIAGAYLKGDPILAYYWEPTWLVGLYDMTMIEEPEYTDECWAAIDEVRQEVVDESLAGNVPEEAGCHYETLAIHKGVNETMPEKAPELVEFLEALFIPTDDLNKIAAYMTAEEVEADAAALWYLQNYEDQWTSWIPEDVAANVKAALP